MYENMGDYAFEDGTGNTGGGFAEWVFDSELGGGGGFDFGNPWAASSFGFDPFTTIGGGTLGGPLPGGGGILDGIGDLFGGGGGSGIPISFGGGGGPDLNETLTSIVDAAERALKANLAAWQQGAASASVATARGWELMNQMVSACGRYGAQGLNSAAERDRRIDPTKLRWDWIAYYIDPITGGPSQPATLPPGISSGFLPTPGGGPLNGTFADGGVNAYLWAGLAAVVLLLIVSRR